MSLWQEHKLHLKKQNLCYYCQDAILPPWVVEKNAEVDKKKADRKALRKSRGRQPKARRRSG